MGRRHSLKPQLLPEEDPEPVDVITKILWSDADVRYCVCVNDVCLASTELLVSCCATWNFLRIREYISMLSFTRTNVILCIDINLISTSFSTSLLSPHDSVALPLWKKRWEHLRSCAVVATRSPRYARTCACVYVDTYTLYQCEVLNYCVLYNID